MSDVKLVPRQMQEESGKLKEATPIGFLTFFDSLQYDRENISECSFLPLRRSVYTSSMEVQEFPVLEIQWCYHTHFSKSFTVTLPKGESQLCDYESVHENQPLC